jgi:hypothetical protein
VMMSVHGGRFVYGEGPTPAGTAAQSGRAGDAGPD